MKSDDQNFDRQSGNWFRVAGRSEIKPGDAKMVRVNGRQVALFECSGKVYACSNLCPHEGYPLSKGTLSGNCTLTCNWHNWKFDLQTGTNLYGGDRLMVYPVQIRQSSIWIDMTDPPFESIRGQIIENLHHAFNDESYDRIAREIARLIQIGADPLESLRCAIEWSWEKLEFGWTHAYAGMADWLTLYGECKDHTEHSLVCLLEPVAHTARDVLREKNYPYGDNELPWQESKFVLAVENEDQSAAIAMLRGGLRAGLDFQNFERALTTAALAHYYDFGHSLIYVSKVGGLISALGDEVMEPLLVSLVRSIVFARREDLIPEFRCYRDALNEWGSVKCHRMPESIDFWGQGIKSSLSLALSGSQGRPKDLYRELLLANAWNLLKFDVDRQYKTHVSISGNVGWLDFTHGITFANAVRKQCTRFPDLWPMGLLQMACFHGRNSAYTQHILPDEWTSGDPDRDIQKAVDIVMDHGQSEPIVSVHLLKTTLAIREEVQNMSANQAVILTAALVRFLKSPLKRRHTRRTAWQSLQFVSREFGTQSL